MEVHQCEYNAFFLRESQDGQIRDVLLKSQLDPRSRHHIGLVRTTKSLDQINLYSKTVDELIWRVGTYKLRIFEKPELSSADKVALFHLSTLQERLEQLGESVVEMNNDASKIHFQSSVSKLLRETNANITYDLRDFHYLRIDIEALLKESIKFVDEDVSKHPNYTMPKTSTLTELHQSGHIKSISNQTAFAVEQSFHYEKPAKKPITLSPWYNYKVPFIQIKMITLLVICLAIAAPWAIPFLQSIPVSGWLINLFLAAPLTAISVTTLLTLLMIASSIQLEPEMSNSQFGMTISYLKRFFTMLTCLFIFINLIAPFNPVNYFIIGLFPSISIHLASSLSIVMGLCIYNAILYSLELVTPSEQIENLEQEPIRIKYYRILVQPYANRCWKLFQYLKQRPILNITFFVGLVLLILGAYQFQIIELSIAALSSIFNVSSTFAAMLIVASGLFIQQLVNKLRQSSAAPTSVAQHDDYTWYDLIVTSLVFIGSMFFILYMDYGILRDATLVITSLLGLPAFFASFSGGLFTILLLVGAAMWIPNKFDLSEAFERNPLAQAEQIFIELNNFYYVTGLKHPILTISLFISFIIGMCSFYYSYIPVIIHDISFIVAKAILSTNTSTFLLALAASLMICNLVIIVYNTYDRGNDSYLARSMRHFEKYPLDMLLYGSILLLIFNTMIYFPAINSHLGSVAIIAVMTFSFKFALIIYDFYRDNEHKSFISSLLMCLLWPLLVTKRLVTNPSIENFIDIAVNFEKSLVKLILIFAHDIPNRIFLRIFEVFVMAIYSVSKLFCKIIGNDEWLNQVCQNEQGPLCFIDKIKFSSHAAIFNYQDRCRLWHLIGIAGLIYMTVLIIGYSISQIYNFSIALNSILWIQYTPITLTIGNLMMMDYFLLGFGIGLLAFICVGVCCWINYSITAIDCNQMIQKLQETICIQAILLFAGAFLSFGIYALVNIVSGTTIMNIAIITVFTQLYVGINQVLEQISLTVKHFEAVHTTSDCKLSDTLANNDDALSPLELPMQHDYPRDPMAFHNNQ